MEPTQCSETSTFNTQTPGKYPEDNSSLLQHGESLKSRNISKLFAKIAKLPVVNSGQYIYMALGCKFLLFQYGPVAWVAQSV
jgi:hypothetical protein